MNFLAAKWIFVILQILISIWLILDFKKHQPIVIENLNKCERILFQEKEISRDFYRYKCKKRIRIGGPLVLDDLRRIDGNLIYFFLS